MSKSLEDLTVDELLARARQTESSATLLASLTANPETRESLQRAIKKVAPSTSIPEIDARDAVAKDLNDIREDNAKLRREIQEKDILDRLEKQRARIIAKYDLSEADLLEIEKLMTRKDYPIQTYDDAALVFKGMKESATPTPALFSAPTFELPEQDIWGKGIGNKAMLDKIAMQQAFAAMNELKSGKTVAN